MTGAEARPVSPLTISPDAARRLSAEADFTRAVLAVRHVLGCGGNGFRIAVEQSGPDEGHRFVSNGIPIVMDDYAMELLDGGKLVIDPDPAGDGYRLDHPNAVLTTFC